MTTQYGPWVYAILAAVIFAETGFVVFPFLPGDSLLFAVGLIAADEKKGLNLGLVFLLLTSAAVIGNVVNYWIGSLFGEKLFSNPKSKIFRPDILAKTRDFFARYGGKTIVLTRFVPVVRAFAPFVAGMGAMEFKNFMVYNVIGGALWVGVCMFAGFFLGEIPIVRERFELAILGLVVVSVLPLVIEFVVHKRSKNRAAADNVLTVKEPETGE